MVTTNNENRRSQRHSLSKITDAHNHFHFHLHVNDCRYEITDIQDVSISGVRIEMEALIPVGTPLTLTYQEDELEISIEAEVIWSEAGDERTQYQTGIKFCPLQGDLATLFFLAFRQQLDSFDQNRHQLQA